MASSYHFTCLKTEGNILLKYAAWANFPLISTYDPVDRTKKYWGYYQNYLVQIY